MNLQYKHKSSIGDLYIVANEKAITKVQWEDQGFPSLDRLEDSAIITQAIREIDEYLAGERKEFNVPYDLSATYSSEFTRVVWSKIEKIGYNKTASYEEVAISTGNDKAARAVGTSSGKNPICIIVPCHRVIPKSMKTGGFSGGCDIKKKLLDIEAKAQK